MQKKIYINESQLNYIKRNTITENKNVDFFKKKKFHITSSNGDLDYAHIIDEIIEDTINDCEKKNTDKVVSKSLINNLVENNELGSVMKSFDVKNNLNDKFWINDKLNSRVRLRLLDIADEFWDSFNIDWAKPDDIIMTGSLANYNWSKYSDIDLHILVDYKKVDKKVDFVKDYFTAKKNIWNEEHENLTIYGFPVEVYVQDINEEHSSSGVYSLEKNKWLVEPEKDSLKSLKLNKKNIAHKVVNFVEKIDKLSDMANKEKDCQKLDEISEKVKALFDKLKNIRKESLKENGEMSTGNIIWKCLRRLNYITKLVDLKSLTYDKINSIK